MFQDGAVYNFMGNYTLQELCDRANCREWPPKANCHFYLEDKSPEWFLAMGTMIWDRHLGRKPK